MTSYYGVNELRRPEDWRSVSGDKNWVPGRSAYELAYHWHGVRGFPPAVQKVFDSGGQSTAGLIPRIGMVELPTFLDIVRAPSRTDIMLYCRNSSDEPFVIAVEGKSTEPFSDPVNVWVRNHGETIVPSRERRLSYLSNVLGTAVTADRTFGYQLVHRTASVISECLLQGASAGMLLVHSFSEENATNWAHFRDFAKLLGCSIPDSGKNTIHGPVPTGGQHKISLFFAWIVDRPKRLDGQSMA